MAIASNTLHKNFSKQDSLFDQRLFHYRICIIALFCSLVICTIYAQTDYAELEWVKTFLGQDSPTVEFGDFTIDNTGNSYHTFVDHSYDSSWKAYYNTVKYNTSGEKLWSSRFLPENDIDNRVYKIALDRYGNVYITGTAISGLFYKTFKYDSSGNLLWISTDSTGKFFFPTPPMNLSIDDSGNVYMAGLTGDIFKYNSKGEKIWKIPKEGRDNFSMILDKNYRYIYLSRSGEIVKFNYDGIREWEVNDTVGYYGGSIVVDGSQNIYINGLGLAKYTSDGMLEWVASSHRDYMTLDNFGNPVVFGYNFDGISEQYKTIKFNSEGIKLWERDYKESPPGSPDMPQSICIDRFNNIYVTASVYDTDGTLNIVTIKYNSFGDEKWTMIYDDPQNQYQYPAVVKVDSVGNVYVAGVIRLDGLRFADIIIKYRQPNYLTSITDKNNEETEYYLFTNYPNPFNASTNIQFSISKTQFISLKIFDVLGKEVAALVNEEKLPGTYTITWNSFEQPSGIYFYRLQTPSGFTETKKLVLLK